LLLEVLEDQLESLPEVIRNAGGFDGLEKKLAQVASAQFHPN
jgi:hypothetical protein